MATKVDGVALRLRLPAEQAATKKKAPSKSLAPCDQNPYWACAGVTAVPKEHTTEGSMPTGATV